MTTTQTTEALEIGIVPCGGEFALTNMTTGEVLSYHLSREAAEDAR